MAVRIPWTKFEIALLIETCSDYKESGGNRSEIIKRLSDKLRLLAERNNIEIDDIYRNENGINMQFAIMSSLLEHRKSGLHDASKAFVDMVKLYENNSLEFLSILKEAKQMLEPQKKNNESRFTEWLSTKVSPAQLSELYMTYEKIDEFCLKRGLLKKPLLQTTDIASVRKVMQTVEQNKVFRFTHKRDFSKIVSAIHHYFTYIKEIDISSSLTDKPETTITQQKSVHIMDTTSDVEPIVQIPAPSTQNVDKNRKLLEKYPIAYKRVYDSLKTAHSVVGDKGVTITAVYENTRHIARTETIEEILNTATWSLKIGNRYIFSEQGDSSDVTTANNTVYADAEYALENFEEWMCSEKHKADTTVRNYISSVKSISEKAIEWMICDIELFRLPNSLELERVIKKLFADERFIELNEIQHNRFSASLKQFLEFRGILSPPTRGRNSYSPTEEQFYDWLVKEKHLAPSTCRTHKLGINETNDYVVKNGISDTPIFDMEISVLSALIDELLKNDDFLKYNDRNYNRLRLAIYKYAEFIGIDNNFGVAGNRVYSAKEDEFENWLQNNAGLATATSRTHKWSINIVNEYIINHTLSSISIFEMDAENVRKLFEKILMNDDFLKFNEENHNRLQTSMSKYAEFIGITITYASTTFKEYTEKENKFFDWLIEEKQLAPSTCRTHKCAINDLNAFIMQNQYSATSIFDMSNVEVKELFNKLLEDEAFLKFNSQNYNRFRMTMYKYAEFIGTEVKTRYIRTNTSKHQAAIAFDFDTVPYEKILAEKFVRGFRIGSGLDMRKFKRFYEELNGSALDLKDEQIERNIKCCCIQYEDKLYLPDSMLSEELRKKLFKFIRDSFLEGITAIYYEVLFNKFSEEFLDYYIYNAEMLKAYIGHYNNNEFYLERAYLSKEPFADINPYDEVKNYLINANVPVEADVVCCELSHIPKTRVMQILGMNAEFIHNGYSVYFHIDIVQFSDTDLDSISSVIQDGINEKEFLSGNELIDILSVRYPRIIENNSSVSSLGMRDAIKYRLKDKFSFNGNIISSHDTSLTMSDVFGQYAKSRTEFDISELETLAKEMNSVIYFGSVYDNSLRVSQSRFVSKKQAQFKIAETDNAIDRFCSGDYIPLGRINEFGTFPDAGFQWNTYLLAHYVYSYSKNYRFFGGFNKTASVGAIVKRSMRVENYDDFLAVALSESGIILNKENALEYLVEQGYIAKRTCSTIEEILIQAKAHRNMRGED